MSTSPAFTALVTACNDNKVAQVQALLAQDAGLASAVDAKGRSALAHTSRRCHLDVVTLLLARGAPVDLPDAALLTALHHAVLAKSRRTVNALVALGAPREARDAHGKTAYDVGVLTGATGAAFALRPAP